MKACGDSVWVANLKVVVDFQQCLVGILGFTVVVWWWRVVGVWLIRERRIKKWVDMNEK